MKTNEEEETLIQNSAAIINELQQELIKKEQRIKELEQNEISLKEILRRAKVGSWCLVTDSGTLKLSKELQEVIGLGPGEVSQTFSYLDYVHQDDILLFKEAIEKAIKTQQPFNSNHRIIKPDGAIIWMLARVKVVLDNNGNVKELIGMEQDITEVKSLPEKHQEINKTNEVFDNLIYTAGQDLRSPISNLKSISRLIQLSDDVESKLQFLNPIDSNVEKLNRTIEALVGILEVKRKEQLMVKHLYFKNILENILIENKEDSDLFKGKIFSNFEKCPDIYYIEAFITSILRNLVINALKYHTDGKQYRITISTDTKDGFVILKVTENRIGFESELFKESTLNPLSQIINNGYEKGLGLYIVKNMIEKNGGYLTVESPENIGTIFIGYLKEYRTDLLY